MDRQNISKGLDWFISIYFFYLAMWQDRYITSATPVAATEVTFQLTEHQNKL